MKPPKFLNVALSEIKVGANNPRKTFDEESVKELAQSIFEKGVLQPIVLRTVKDKKGYELVCGERRFRAAMLVKKMDGDRLDIPATIHFDLSDNDALELQITENLQRADIHPMEEAFAFKALIETKKYDVKEIGKRLGKSHYYVGQRMLLNNLIEPLQTAFFQNRMKLVLALTLCKFNQTVQDTLWKNELKNQTGEIEINSWTLNKYLGNLNTAAFDKKDAELNKSMGACNTCQHNTAHDGNLFPEEASSARCLFISCFHKKVDTHFKKELDIAKNDGTIVLVCKEYGGSTMMTQLKKEDVTVYARKEYSDADLPEQPNIEDFESNLEDGEYPNKKAMLLEFEKQTKRYQTELADAQKRINNGSYLKAFVVSGDEKGTYTYVKLISKTKAIAKGGAQTSLDAANEIARLQQREDRAKELDEVKVLPAIYDIYKNTFYETKDGEEILLKEICNELKAHETSGLVILLLNSLSWSDKDSFYQHIGFDIDDETDYSFYVKLKTASLDFKLKCINILTRILIINKFEPHKHSYYSKQKESACLVDIAGEYDNEGVQKLLNYQNEFTVKREQRVNNRIKSLKASIIKNKPNEETVKPSKKFITNKPTVKKAASKKIE